MAVPGPSGVPAGGTLPAAAASLPGGVQPETPSSPAGGMRPAPGDPLAHLLSYPDLVHHVQERTGWPRGRSGDLAALLIREGVRSGVDPWLLAAVIEVESGFRADAVGSSGEIGLMQILPSTARRVAAAVGIDGFTRESLFDPAVNVRLGAAHLGSLLARFHGDEVAALTTYNAGRSTSTDGTLSASRVLAVAQRASSEVRVAWAPAR
ncbi:MAG: hypothetical protein DIU84_07330 [Bacillota bacterium]|nr:MAG: hypothetical protein DIU84_07330 [Bacillota bacterium]